MTKPGGQPCVSAGNTTTLADASDTPFTSVTAPVTSVCLSVKVMITPAILVPSISRPSSVRSRPASVADLNRHVPPAGPGSDAPIVYRPGGKPTVAKRPIVSTRLYAPRSVDVAPDASAIAMDTLATISGAGALFAPSNTTRPLI